jgi:hypothetical protein
MLSKDKKDDDMYTLNRYGQARYAAQQNYKKLKHGFRQPAFWQATI